jgi:tetratricopeptide (TPR) repeat protein
VTEADADLLNRLLNFYINFSSRNEASPELAAQTAKAQRRVGEIYQRLGRHEEAIAAYENARSQYQVLSLTELEPSLEEISERPDGPVSYDSTLTVAAISNQISGAAAQAGDPETAVAAYDAADDYLSSLPSEVQELRETRFLLAQTKTSFASLASRIASQFGGFNPNGFGGGGPPGSRDSKRYSKGGNPRGGRDGNREADVQSRDSGQSRTGGRPKFLASNRGPGGRPDHIDSRDGASDMRRPGGGRSGFGPLGGGSGREFGRGHGPPADVEERLRNSRVDARNLLEGLIDEDSQQPDYQLELAKLLLASTSFRGRDQGSADPMADLNKAITILEQLAQDHPGNPDYQFQLADALALTSRETQRYETPEQVTERYSRSIEIARKLQKQFPNAPEYDILLANSLRRLSGLQNDQGELAPSQKSVDEAVSILQRLTEVWPGHMIYRLSLAHALQQSAMLGRRLRNSDLTLQRLDEAAALFDDEESFDNQPLFVRALLFKIHQGRSEFFKRTGRDSEATEAWELAIKLVPWMTKGPGGPRPDDRNYGRPGGSERYPQHQKPPQKSKGPPQGQPDPDNGRPERDSDAGNSTETDRPKRDRPPAK